MGTRGQSHRGGCRWVCLGTEAHRDMCGCVYGFSTVQAVGTHARRLKVCVNSAGLTRMYLVFLKLLPLPLLQGSPALFGFEPLLLQPAAALLELLLPKRLGLLLLLQPHCLLGRWDRDEGA